MQDDPSQYRVPILKLSDILGEDGQDGTTEGTDTAVTGMSWHTVEQPSERPVAGLSRGPTPVVPASGVNVHASIKTADVQSEVRRTPTPIAETVLEPTETAQVSQAVQAPNPEPPVHPAVPQPSVFARDPAPGSALSPKRQFVAPVQDVVGDALDEPTPHPLGQRATASIRATVASQESKTISPSTPTVAVHEPAPELPDFQQYNAPELPPLQSSTTSSRPRPAKDIDPLDIWDRPATAKAPVARKPLTVATPPAVQEVAPAPIAPTPETSSKPNSPAERVPDSAPERQLVPPAQSTDVPNPPSTQASHLERPNSVPDIWSTFPIGVRTVKPPLPRTADVIRTSPTADTPSTTPTPTPLAPPHIAPAERVVEKTVVPPPPPVPAPPIVPIQEASAEDLSDLLDSLVPDEIAPTPQAPVPVASPTAVPVVDTPAQRIPPVAEASTPPAHTVEAVHVEPPTKPTPTQPAPTKPSTPTVPLGTDVPDMWSTVELHHAHNAHPPKAPTPPSAIPKIPAEEKHTVISEPPITPPAQSVPPPPVLNLKKEVPSAPSTGGGSNLAELRDRVMKESIGKPGDVVAPPTAGGVSAVSNTRTPSTKHAQAISEIANKLGVLIETPVGAPQTALTDPTTHSSGDSAEGGAPTKPVESGELPLMRTFKQDVQQTVLHNKTSIVDMISSNEKKRAIGEVVIHKGKGGSWFTPTIYVLLGTSALLLIGAVAVGVMVFLPAGDEISTVTYFTPDAVIAYDTAGLARDAHLQGLLGVRDEIPLRDGFATQVSLREKIVLPISGETEIIPITTHRLLRIWEILPPETLDRSLTENFMFGYMSLDANHPFLILESNYFQGAFSGMLDWEHTIASDLNPLFPTGRAGAQVPNATPRSAFTTGTTTATTTADTPLPPDGLSTFEDISIANIPARVLRDQNGTALLLWCMPDDRILITTNEEVLRRLIDRIQAREF